MPITKQSRDGTVHNFADGTPDAVIARVMNRYEQEHGGPDIASDVVGGAFETGPAKGVSGILGAPGDFAELGAQGYDAAKRQIQRLLGLSESEPREPQAPKYGSEYFQQKYAENVLGHDIYQPKTPWGKGAALVTEMAPGMLGGPGGLIPKGAEIAKRAISQVAAPAAAALGSEQFTDNPWAQMGATVAAPSIARRGMNPGLIDLTPSQQMHRALLKREGVPLTAGEITGSTKILNAERIADMGASAPKGALAKTIYKDLSDKTQDKALTAAAARTSPDLPPGTKHFLDPQGNMTVLPDAARKIGVEYDALFAPYNIDTKIPSEVEAAKSLMSPAEIAKLASLDKRYATVMTLLDASKSSGPTGAQGFLTPGAFFQASKDYPAGTTGPLATAAHSVLGERGAGGIGGREMSHSAFAAVPSRQGAHILSALLTAGAKPIVANRLTQAWLRRPRPRATAGELAQGVAKSVLLRTTPQRLPWEEEE